jgi:hypothetical protein
MKLLVFTLPGMLAYPMFAAGLLGGLALLLGVYARQTALLFGAAPHWRRMGLRAQRLATHQPERRLGVPGFPRDRIAGAVADRRRRFGMEAQPGAGAGMKWNR